MLTFSLVETCFACQFSHIFIKFISFRISPSSTEINRNLDNRHTTFHRLWIGLRPCRFPLLFLLKLFHYGFGDESIWLIRSYSEEIVGKLLESIKPSLLSNHSSFVYRKGPFFRTDTVFFLVTYKTCSFRWWHHRWHNHIQCIQLQKWVTQ
jgi:hypothetical protein